MNTQLIIDKPHMLQNFLVLGLFGLGLYVDIASMYHLHIEIDHSLRPAAYH